VWYNPQPKQRPKRLPRRYPLKTIPSGIGDEGIVANWLFYYLKGGDHLHDFSENGNHGDIKGAIWKDGSYGWSLDFDGAGDYVSLPLNINDASKEELTFTFWVNFDTLERQNFYGSWDGSNAIEIRMEDTDGSLSFFTFDRSVYGILDTAYTVSAGEWYFIVCVYDSSAGYKIYVNGEQQASSSDTTFATDTRKEFLGGHNADGALAREMNGKMTITRIYTMTKKSSWITRRFNRTKGIFK